MYGIFGTNCLNNLFPVNNTNTQYWETVHPLLSNVVSQRSNSLQHRYQWMCYHLKALCSIIFMKTFPTLISTCSSAAVNWTSVAQWVKCDTHTSIGWALWWLKCIHSWHCTVVWITAHIKWHLCYVYEFSTRLVMTFMRVFVISWKKSAVKVTDAHIWMSKYEVVGDTLSNDGEAGAQIPTRDQMFPVPFAPCTLSAP